jgi:hypothetical protein
MKAVAYGSWLAVSLIVVVILRNVVQGSPYAGLFMGITYAAVIGVFLVIRNNYSKAKPPSDRAAKP